MYAELQQSSAKANPTLARSPRPPTLDCLHGIRALSNAAIVLAHVIYALSIPPHHTAIHADVTDSLPLRWSLNAFLPAMDTFFCLSGLLACYHLVPAMQSSKHTPLQAALGYYRRRVLRLVPHYYTTLLLSHLAIQVAKGLGEPHLGAFLSFRHHTYPLDMSFRTILSSLLFVHNLTCGGMLTVTWNLAVQMQFYTILPVILLMLRPRTPGFKGRVAAAAVGLLAVSLAYLEHSFHNLGIRLPVFHHQIPGDPGFDAAQAMLKGQYMSTLARLCNFALGMLAGCLALTPSAIEAIRRRWLAASAASFLASSLVLNIACHVPALVYREEEHLDPQLAHFAYVWFLGFIHPTAITVLVVFCMCGPGPIGRLVSHGLSLKVWRWPSKVSYSVYLLHALAIAAVWKGLAALHAHPAHLFLGPDGGEGSRLGAGWQLQRLGVLGVLWVAVQGLSSVGAVVLDATIKRLMGQVYHLS